MHLEKHSKTPAWQFGNWKDELRSKQESKKATSASGTRLQYHLKQKPATVSYSTKSKRSSKSRGDACFVSWKPIR